MKMWLNRDRKDERRVNAMIKKLISFMIIFQFVMAIPVRAEGSIRIVRGILISTPNQIIIQGIPIIETKPIPRGILIAPPPVVTETTTYYSQPAVYRERVVYEDSSDDMASLGVFLGFTALVAALTIPGCHGGGHHGFHHFHH